MAREMNDFERESLKAFNEEVAAPSKFIPMIKNKEGFELSSFNTGVYKGYLYLVKNGGMGERLKKSIK